MSAGTQSQRYNLLRTSGPVMASPWGTVMHDLVLKFHLVKHDLTLIR